MEYLHGITNMTKDDDEIIRWRGNYLFKSYWGNDEKEKEVVKKCAKICQQIESRNEYVNFKSFYTEYFYNDYETIFGDD